MMDAMAYRDDSGCIILPFNGYEWVFEPRRENTMTLVAIRGIDEKPDRDPDDMTLERMPPHVRRWVCTHQRDYVRLSSSIVDAMGARGACSGVLRGP